MPVKKPAAATLAKVRNQRVAVTDNVARVASIPPIAVADKYEGRSFGGKSDFELFDLAMENEWCVLLEGDTGTGKTMAARAYAASRRMHFYSTPSNVGIDPSQMLGKFIPDPTGNALGVWQDGPVTDLVRHGGVLLINEINFLPARVATALFSLLDGRREISLLDHKGEVIKAHPDLLIIADMNPDYLGTTTLNAALRNRFEIQLQWDYDPNVEKKLIQQPTIRTFAANMRKMFRDGQITTPTSTNMLQEFERIASVVGVDFAMQNLVNHYSPDDRRAVQEALRAMKGNLEAEYLPKPTPKQNGGEEGQGRTDSSGWDFGEDIAAMTAWINDDGNKYDAARG